jgi:cleavage and polyadenylation specificity factor subunit 2
MMEWLGGTISKEDVGAEGQDPGAGNKGGKGPKRKRDDDGDDEALGAFALRFPSVHSFISCPQT